MSLLITKEDIAEFKSLSENIDATLKVNPFILEAQEFELRVFLGDEFYIDLLEDFNASPSLVKYKDLFNGSVYICGTTKYENPGIKPMLVYYAYARIVQKGSTNSTAFGFVEKVNEDSKPISERTIVRLVEQAMSGAKAYENRVRLFLSRNSADFPLWECGGDNLNVGSSRISAVGGNQKGSHRRNRRHRNDNHHNDNHNHY